MDDNKANSVSNEDVSNITCHGIIREYNRENNLSIEDVLNRIYSQRKGLCTDVSECMLIGYSQLAMT